MAKGSLNSLKSSLEGKAMTQSYIMQIIQQLWLFAEREGTQKTIWKRKMNMFSIFN